MDRARGLNTSTDRNESPTWSSSSAAGGDATDREDGGRSRKIRGGFGSNSEPPTTTLFMSSAGEGNSSPSDKEGFSDGKERLTKRSTDGSGEQGKNFDAYNERIKGHRRKSSSPGRTSSSDEREVMAKFNAFALDRAWSQVPSESEANFQAHKNTASGMGSQAQGETKLNTELQRSGTGRSSHAQGKTGSNPELRRIGTGSQIQGDQNTQLRRTGTGSQVQGRANLNSELRRTEFGKDR